MTIRGVPLRHLADIRVSNVDKKSRGHEQPVRLVNYTDVYYGDRITPDLELMRATASTDQVRNFGLRCGDVLITKDSESANDIGVPALVDDVTHEMVCGYHLAILRPRQGIIDSRFLYWSLNSAYIRSQMEITATGITRFGLRTEAIGQAKIDVPPYSAQHRIADYLDTYASRIDALIAAKRRQQELLEQRRSILPEATLAMLRLSEPMVPLKHLVGERNARNVSNSSSVLLSVSIHHGVVPRSETYENRPQPDDLTSYKLCKPGNIVVNRMRAFQGGVGEARHDGVVSPDYTVLRVNDRMISGYLHFVMRSSWFVSEMTQRLRGIGSTDQGQVRTPRINFVDLGEIRVPVPSRRSQQEFVSDLIVKEADITRALNLQDKQIDLLVERRQALVTSAVAS